MRRPTRSRRRAWLRAALRGTIAQIYRLLDAGKDRKQEAQRLDRQDFDATLHEQAEGQDGCDWPDGPLSSGGCRW